METITYRRAVAESELVELVNILEKHKIYYLIREVDEYFNQLQLSMNAGFKYYLDVRPGDVPQIEKLLATEIEADISKVSKDHYLFDFDDNELYEILLYPAEWNAYDVKLASEILRQRGKDPDKLPIATIKTVHENRQDKNRRAPRALLWFGYIFALLGGLIAIIIGYAMAFGGSKDQKGEFIYEYVAEDRIHGQRIFYIGIIVILLSGILYYLTEIQRIWN
jgi:hypothetical protein